MEQVIVGGYYSRLSQSATEYTCLMGGRYWWADESWHYQCMPTGGTIKDLYVELSGNVAADSSFVFTLMLDGSPTSLEVTINAGTSTGHDTTHEVSVAAGQTVSIRSTYTGTPGTPWAYWSTKFVGSTSGESILLLNRCTDKVATVYGEVTGKGFYVASSDDEVRVQTPVPTSGTIKKLHVKLPSDPGDSPEGYSWTLRKNGENTALTCTITADETSASDTEHEVTVAAGDLISLLITPLNSPTNIPDSAIGMVFVPDVDGESLILGGCSYDQPNDTNTEYSCPCGAGYGGWHTNESRYYQLVQVCTLKKFYIHLDRAPSAGDNYTISVNAEGGATGITVTISDTDVSGNDVAHTYEPSNGDRITLKSVPVSDPDSVYVHTGLVCYIESGAPPARIPRHGFVNFQNPGIA